MGSRVKLTISLAEDLAAYLRSRPNASAVVAEAVELYRSRELADELERAYREDAEEAEAINSQWQPVDSEIDE